MGSIPEILSFGECSVQHIKGVSELKTHARPLSGVAEDFGSNCNNFVDEFFRGDVVWAGAISADDQEKRAEPRRFRPWACPR